MSARNLFLAAAVAAALTLPATTAVADTAPAAGEDCSPRDSRTPVTLEDGTVLECQKNPDNPRHWRWVITFEPEAPATPEEGAECEEGAEPVALEDGTVLECTDGVWAVVPEDEDDDDDDDTGGENGGGNGNEDEDGGETDPTYRSTVVTFVDDCDGVSGSLEFGDHPGQYRYSVWHDGELVAENLAGEQDGVISWDPAAISEARVVVEHKLKGKKSKWVSVTEDTHTYTAPAECEDDGQGTGTDEDDKPTPGADEEGKGGEDNTQQAGADSTLPVTGGALAGLVAAAIAAAGAGGGALYLARKRKAAAGE